MVTDYYKPGKNTVANNGGIVGLFAAIIVIPIVFYFPGEAPAWTCRGELADGEGAR